MYYFMPAMGSFGKSGVPDLICCIRGAFFAIEVKADKHKNPPTALQEKNLCEIRMARGHALVIDNNDLDFLKGYIDGVIQAREDVEDMMAAAFNKYAL